MENTILIRYGELFLKGKNKNYFEKTLLNNIRDRIKHFENARLVKISGRYFICDYNESDEFQIIETLSKVFGIHSISPAKMFDTSVENITNHIESLTFTEKNFRVSVKRADKSFPIRSAEFAAKMGGIILKHNNHLKVDLINPEVEVNIDIRENGKTFVFFQKINCLGGMPVSTAGRGLLLLSGGIDSPVAGFMMAKRGMSITALHFHSYPYTSEQAKQKVLDLARILSDYTGNIRVYVCGFTKAQEEIHKNCNEEYMITIMRRIMMRIAERLCKNNGFQTIITGESLGQVASQTIESITVTNGVIETLPVLRPLIGMDKSEITEISRNINTYKTSILPYEDCCTVFLPDHPVIKPKLEKVLAEESKLDIETLVEDCLNNMEIIETKDME